MVDAVNQLDWSETALGPIGTWPDSIRAAAGIVLNSTFQLALLCGPEMVYIYNDETSDIFGDKHPWALGKPASLVWHEAWSTLGPMLHSVLDTGRALRHDDLLLVLHRHGFTEECYFTFSYSPVQEGTGEITGVFIAALETSERVINERRLRTLGDLAARVASDRSEGAYAGIADTLGANPYDLPFTALYMVEPDSAGLRLMFQTGGVDCRTVVAPGQPGHPVLACMDGADVQVFDAALVLPAAAVCGAWPEAPRQGMAFPLKLPGRETVHAVLMLGVNPRKELNDAHRSFLELVAGHVATAIANVEAAHMEQQRLSEMALLDRSKTVFFANASHELRTPLTLILGPLESLLDDPREPLSSAVRESLDMARRNALRMKRLLNSILDFARIEAGHLQVRLEATDLGALTMELASLFQPGFAAAGIGYSVSVPAAPVAVWMDCDMWEKIVLNLLSNARKFTRAGQVRLALAAQAGAVVLTIDDTGVGIDQADLPRIFERFYRGARSGTGEGTEGSGIGLALAAELVRMLDGAIDVNSAPEQGSTFSVRIPVRGAALGELRGADAAPPALLARSRASYVEPTSALSAAMPPAHDAQAATALQEAGAERFKVVVVDDSQDIVNYLRRLLQDSCTVVSADNAVDGLAAIRAVAPDIVLLDVMMPRIDGFEMLRIMRADSQIQAVPVIVLSAHVGEDARMDALSAGADDYLAKPFSARELVAMVRSHIRLVRIRRSAMVREGLLLTQIARVRHDLESVIQGTSDAFVSLDHDLRILAINEVAAGFSKRPCEQLIGQLLAEVEPDSAPVEQAMRRAMHQQRTIGIDYHHSASGRWLHLRCYPAPHGVIVFGSDITAQKRAQSRLKDAHAELERMVVERTRKLDSANQLLKTVFDQAPAAIVMTDNRGRIVRANAAFQQLVGFSEPKLRALTIQRFSDAAGNARRQRQLNLLLAGAIPNFELEMAYRRADGSVIQVENVVAMIGGGEGGRTRFIVEITQDITERRRAEEEIRASQVELRALYERLQGIRKDERIALARDVHDQLGQVLSAAKIDIKLLLDEIESRQAPLPRQRLLCELRSASTALDQAIGSVRSIATELRPPQIDNQGLYAAIAWHARDFERRTRIKVTLSLPDTGGGPGGAAAAGLFRIFQEAMTNVIRHARASAVEISLQLRGERLLLRVRDHGVGLAHGRKRATGTLGLVGMRERAALAGGRVAIARLGSGGTLVSALLPVLTPLTDSEAP